MKVLSITQNVSDWLLHSQQPRILHIFDVVCNLVNERQEVLSIVAPQVGNGPFNLMIQGQVSFLECVDIDSPVSLAADQLMIGDLIIKTPGAKLWNPRPDWEILHANRATIFNQLTQLPITAYSTTSLGAQFSNSLISSLSQNLAIADIPSSIIAAKQLAGLGLGLTPAGDDFMMGAMYAAWIIHSTDVAKLLTEKIANTAAPLTTSLSAAWLKSAGKGEAGILWHYFFETLTSHDHLRVEEGMTSILAVGETSGADALWGFISTLSAWTQEAPTQNG